MDFDLLNVEEVRYWNFDVMAYVNGEYRRIPLRGNFNANRRRSLDFDSLIKLLLENISNLALWHNNGVTIVHFSGSGYNLFYLEFKIEDNMDFLNSLGISEANENMWRCNSGDFVISESSVSENLEAFLRHFISVDNKDKA